jgi:hypothetical protein
MVLFLATLLSFLFFCWFFVDGSSLYYGDAEAHLNIARRIWDNRDPGYHEIGTVWLPLPHLLFLPLTFNDTLWRNGAAGAIPPAICFILACWLFFRALRSSLDSTTAALAGVTLLALNPNLLFLQASPMTEAIFLCFLAGILYASLKDWPLRAALLTLGATMTRYDGWALIPAVFLYFLFKRRWFAAIAYGLIASLGPVYWLLHNWWLYGSALYFYDGPWSAKAIYQRQLDGGMQRHPADGNWLEAIHYFFTASRYAIGESLLLIGIGGALCFAWKRRATAQLWPLIFLSIPSLFYIASLHSGGTPIFIPGLWPNSYYNSRYALSMLPLAAYGAAALIRVIPRDRRTMAVVGILIVCFLPWIALRNRPSRWIVLREAEVNSEVRRDWTARAGNYLWTNYKPGDGIWYSFGDLTGILRFAGIPLRETMQEGNELQWYSTLARPDLFLRETWVIAFAGSPVAKAMAKMPYEAAATFDTGGHGPSVIVFRRKAPPVLR